MVAIGAALFWPLHRQVVPSYRSFLYRISTTGARSSENNKEVAA